MKNDSNYGLFSPIPKFGYPDYKEGSSKYNDWIEEQVHYILNGYQVGGDKIFGRQYFQLNFTKMLLLGNDGYEYPNYPFYTDTMREFYDLLEWCDTNEKNIIVGKGRDKGFSYNIASICLREAQFHDYVSLISLFPGGKSTAKAKFKEKYDLAFSAMPEAMRLYPSLSDSKDTLRYGWKSTDSITGQKDEEGSMSSIVMTEAVSADIAKSGRYRIICMEEFGELKNPLSIIQTNKANMRKGAKKFGITIAGGTTNAMNTGYADFRELWYNPEPYDFVKLFIPAQKMYFPYVNLETGVSDTAGAERHILKGRANLKGKELMIEKQNYPLTEKDMFIVIQNSPYSADKIAEQVQKIYTDKTIQKAIEQGNLHMDKSGGGMNVEWRITPATGRWKIFKHPKTGLLSPDVGGVDGYRFADVEESDSKGAIVIYRGFQGAGQIGNLPICIYHNRPEDKEEFFKDCLMTAIYFKCQLLIEHTDDDIFRYFERHGALKYLKTRPNLTQSPYSKATYTFGVKANTYSVAVSTEYCVKEFTDNYENVVFLELLDELTKVGTANTDLADAYRWSVLHAMDNVKLLPEYQKEKKKKGFMPFVALDGSGKSVVVTNARQEEILYRNYGNFTQNN